MRADRVRPRRPRIELNRLATVFDRSIRLLAAKLHEGPRDVEAGLIGLEPDGPVYVRKRALTVVAIVLYSCVNPERFGIPGIIGDDSVEMLVGPFQCNDLVAEHPAPDALVARDDLDPIVFDAFDDECEVVLARNLAALDEDGSTGQLENNLGTHPQGGCGVIGAAERNHMHAEDQADDGQSRSLALAEKGFHPESHPRALR